MLPLISNTAVTSFADVVPNVHDIIFPYALLRRVEPRMCGGAAASPNGAIRTPARRGAVAASYPGTHYSHYKRREVSSLRRKKCAYESRVKRGRVILQTNLTQSISCTKCPRQLARSNIPQMFRPDTLRSMRLTNFL